MKDYSRPIVVFTIYCDILTYLLLQQRCTATVKIITKVKFDVAF